MSRVNENTFVIYIQLYILKINTAGEAIQDEGKKRDIFFPKFLILFVFFSAQSRRSFMVNEDPQDEGELDGSFLKWLKYPSKPTYNRLLILTIRP
ncbi:hypothetical protein NPIL_150881 [Nephila pilipes]|uniref:Uncharacterized protein n=1 Tax=Nephila pilipes TaxID=299642 RepID=A0A8X6UKG2_NEPPI|nr:hypothetical protein NPIL_150881 [Nephila pilipes]